MVKSTAHALIIGIDEYPYLDPDRRLHGAVADATAIADLLRRKIDLLNQRILLDDEATRDAVLDALDAVVATVDTGDEVLIYWSGHGSQIRDEERDDEDDGWDETLVPCDSGRGIHDNRDIVDDEIFTRVEVLGAVTDKITFIFDSCHSGTAVRTGVRGVHRDPRPRALGVGTTEKASRQRGTKPRGSSGWLPLSDKYVLLAACRDDQEALELPFGGQIRGAFTWALCRELENAPVEASWFNVFEPVAKKLASSTYGAQIPQVEGEVGRALPWSEVQSQA